MEGRHRRENPIEQTLLVEIENRHRLRGILYALATVFILIMYLSAKMSFVLASINQWDGGQHWGQWFLFWMSLLVGFFCISSVSKANYCESLLKEARAKVSENAEP